jgi:demethylmenaquinone methyltransferase/2-methoxy-6-polyprenyl-1,4-benzoquinol methylase
MTYQAEKILPYADNREEPKGIQVEKMFDEIAGQYDLLNHTLSFGIDYYWRKKGILALKNIRPGKILDVATGTGDLALQACKLLKPQHITGIDISEGMMQIGRKKIAAAGLTAQIELEGQDCMNLQFPDDSFDAAMVAFGVRNFENLDQGLKEIRRVLRPEGKLMILELSSPEYFPMKQGYQFYSRVIIPVLGRLISKNRVAYTYLPESVAAFPQNKALKTILEKNGFKEVQYKKLTLGICTLYFGKK